MLVVGAVREPPLQGIGVSPEERRDERWLIWWRRLGF